MSNKIYGLDADLQNSKFVRLADAAVKEPGADFDEARMYSGRRRCNLTNDGAVLSYFGDKAYSETGVLTTAVSKDGKEYPAGTQVQVMLEQPKFYYKVEPVVLEDISGGIGKHLRRAKWYVSDEKHDGFKIHPNFMRNGKEYDFIYSAAYEGCLFDESAGAYCLEDEQIFETTVESGDMLSSIAGAKPASGPKQFLTRANGRFLTANRGLGWQIIDFLSLNATEILMIIEYADFNMQKKIGNGVVGKESGTVNAAEKTGQTSSLGNKTGNAPGEDKFSSVTYRGEENLWGNIWTIVEGLNFECSGINHVYYADHDYKNDSKAVPYKNSGFTLCKVDGYTTAFGYAPECDYMFLTSETSENENGPVGDFFMQKNAFEGFTIPMLGGRWHQGPKAGPFFWYADCMTENHSQNVNIRIMYVPRK